MSSYDEKMLKEDTNIIKSSAGILRSSISRIIWQNEHMLDLIRVLRRDNDDLFNERRSLLKDKEDLIAANKLLQEQLKPEKKKHVKTAEEIAKWCGSEACAVCNHMQIDGGNGKCDLEIYGDGPCCWSTHAIETLNNVIKFSTQQESANVIVTDEEADE